MACRVCRSSRDLPGRHRIATGVLAVLEDNAHRCELVADAIGFFKILSRARSGAGRNKCLDLVLIAPTAVPPVAKAVDFGHYQYDLKKKQHDAKKKQHVVQVKELKFRPNTDDHDYDFKMNHAIRFLQEGNRVKAVVQFRGREIAHADLDKKLLMRFAADLTQYGTVEAMPRLEGRNAHILISPTKTTAKPAGSEKPEKPEKAEKSPQNPPAPPA